MNELGSILHDVLGALGIDGPEGTDPRRGGEAGDHHPRPAMESAGM